MKSNRRQSIVASICATFTFFVYLYAKVFHLAKVIWYRAASSRDCKFISTDKRPLGSPGYMYHISSKVFKIIFLRHMLYYISSCVRLSITKLRKSFYPWFFSLDFKCPLFKEKKKKKELLFFFKPHVYVIIYIFMYR